LSRAYNIRIGNLYTDLRIVSGICVVDRDPVVLTEAQWGVLYMGAEETHSAIPVNFDFVKVLQVGFISELRDIVTAFR